MAHYAFIDDTNTVTEVIVGKDEADTVMDWEIHYAEFRPGTRCLRTSYNTYGGVHQTGGTPYRKNYAGIGFVYDEQLDAFIPPKLFASWVLDEDTCLWEPPFPCPTDTDVPYIWDEETVNWIPPPTE